MYIMTHTVDDESRLVVLAASVRCNCKHGMIIDTPTRAKLGNNPKKWYRQAESMMLSAGKTVLTTDALNRPALICKEHKV